MNVELKNKEELEKRGVEEIIKSIKENPMDNQLYNFIENFDKKNAKKLSEILGIKERNPKKMAKDMEESLLSLEQVSALLEREDEEDIEEFSEALETGDGKKIKNPKIQEASKSAVENNDISKMFIKKEISFSGKKIEVKDAIRKYVWKRRMKRLLKKISESKFYQLMLILDRADPLEAEAILSKLLPALIQSGVGEEGIKKIINVLLSSLKKGKIKGSKEFFTKLNKIVATLKLFGGGESIINMLRDVL